MGAKLDTLDRDQLLAKFKNKLDTKKISSQRSNDLIAINPKYTSFGQLPAYKQLQLQLSVARNTGVLNPFFIPHEGKAKAKTIINGKKYLNFSTYDYLDLNGDSRIEKEVKEALKRYGTSATASRLVSGEKPIHRQLEENLALHYNQEDCICFVSGHATNVSTISHIFNENDIIFHDQLAHNSIVLGAVDSGAKRISYPHDDMKALEKLLKEHREKYQRALIVTEGVFSMDGNIANLPELIKLKKQYSTFLMVDEAHALGVIGKNGYGSFEHYNIDPKEVDIWMGTLSKTLCSCGGYICGCKELVTLLKFTAPAFVYSVGLSPVLAAASNEALNILHKEPYRTKKLQENALYALDYAKKMKLDTGKACGTAIIPIIVGSSLLAGSLAHIIFEKQVNAQPIIYPVVEEGQARIRLFLSSAHSFEDIKKALDIICQSLECAKQKVANYNKEQGIGDGR